MAKIKVVSVAVNQQGSIYIADTAGKLWLKPAINGAWMPVDDLPEDNGSDFRVRTA